MDNWKLTKASDFIEFNPRESIRKGVEAKKIGMERLQPFTRDIPSYEIAPFNGGTKFRNGDTIMARITPCLENGKTAFVNVLEGDEVGFGSTEYIVLRARPEISNPYYIYYLTMSPILREKAIKSMVGSSGRQRVQQGVVNDIEFLAPPLAEQIEIANILCALDDKIANNTKINHHLEQMARAVFVDFQKMNVGEMSTVADVVDFNTDTYSPKENWTFVNYLDTGNITDGVIETVQRIDVGSEKLPSRARRKVKTNDIVYSTVRPIQRHFGIISHPSDNMLVSTGFAVIHSNHSAVCNEYLYLLLTAEDTIAQLQQLAEQSVSTYPSVKPSDIGLREILVPTSEDGEELRNQLSPLFSYMAANREESIRLAALRDTLLPRLMSGELSVADVTAK